MLGDPAPLGLDPDGVVELLELAPAGLEGLTPAGVLGRAPGMLELTPVGSLGFTIAGFLVAGSDCIFGTVFGVAELGDCAQATLLPIISARLIKTVVIELFSFLIRILLSVECHVDIAVFRCSSNLR